MSGRICKCGARTTQVYRDKEPYYHCTGCGREEPIFRSIVPMKARGRKVRVTTASRVLQRRPS